MSSRQIPSADIKPEPRYQPPQIHTVSLFVSNKPGVLGRICQVFSRRGFNIDSLVVSQGRNPEFSRMTVGISGQEDGLEQIIKQCNKLVDVIHCYEHKDSDSVTREMVLIKILAGPAERTEILQIVKHYSGKTVDLNEDSLILMIHGNTDKVDAALRMLGKFDISETVRTGKVVMARGNTET